MSTDNITTSAPAIVDGKRNIEVITSEVIQLKADAGNAIIGIGERLIEAKEMLAHGEWLPWLTDQVEFSERSAQEFMKIAREWSNPRTLADYGKSKALKLLLLPPTEREEFIETHDVEDMSVRELQKAIRERDEAKKAAEYSEKKLDELSRAFDESQTALEAKASISGDADLAAFQLLFEQVQTDVNKMRGLLLKVRGREDGDLGEKLAKALLALADAVKESAA